MSRTVIFIEGGARGSPGPAAAGVVIQTEGGETIAEDSIFLGRMTNNAAEYHALIRGLQVASQRGIKEIDIRCAGELLVRQIKGEFQVRNPSLSPLYHTATQLLRSYRSWAIEQVTREQNHRAEFLVNQELDRRDSATRRPTVAPAPLEPNPGRKSAEFAAEPSRKTEPDAGAPQARVPATRAMPSQPVFAEPASPVFRSVRAEVVKAHPRSPLVPCELEVGARFDFGRTCPPGVPLLVLHALLPYVICLQRGGAFDFGGVDPDGISCTSEAAFYLFRLNRL